MYRNVWAPLGAIGLWLTGCGGGGGGGGGSAPLPNPVPSIAALSPNSSEQGGPSFILSVVGSNFLSGSTVQWNGSSQPTTFVSGALLTAAIPASAVAGAGPDSVTVVNPSPGGGTSSSLTFAVPCVIASPGSAYAQTKARIGFYFFDGWSGPLTGFHFKGLPLGPYQDREPLSAWQDSSTCAIEQQLAWAHNFGIDFFVFEWYYNATINNPGENLNSALQITHALPDRHGMQFAIMYVTGEPFNVPQSGWTAAVNEWVSYMTDPDYVRVNGKPLFVILDVSQMRNVFGDSAGVSNALNQLRAAAQAQGLPGVYISGNFGVPEGVLGQPIPCCGLQIAQSDGYDAVQVGAGPFTAPPVNGVQSFSTLSSIYHWAWDQSTLYSPIPAVPVLMDGWDPRPWDELSSSGILTWYSRSPREVAQLVSDAINWANSNPRLRLEPPPTPPLVLVASWNELGEGNHVIPTVSEGSSYGEALATMLTTP